MSSPQSLPDDPRLAEVARELEKTRGAAMLCDGEWTLVWISEELQALIGEQDAAAIGVGKHVVEAWLTGPWPSMITIESQVHDLYEVWPRLMHDTPGGRAGLLEILKRGLENCHPSAQWWTDPAEISQEALEQLLEPLASLEEQPPPRVWSSTFGYIQGDLPPTPINEVFVRLHDDDGSFLGTVIFYDPGLPARVLALVSRGDEGMFQRMARLVEPGRKQAAVLFADLQASSALSRRLPSAAYFRLIRGLTTAIDEVVGRQHGIVGKHAGDGVTAFFLAEDLGSASAAARAAIATAREISGLAKEVAGELAEEIGLIESELCRINVGVHWGGRLYMGQLVTGGRLEVTALGDAVNECARIQESASDGAILGSKSLIEHLTDADAAAVALDPDTVLYRTIDELESAPEKARRDAGGIPVTPL
ncbi:MAG: adenylate/guanylate cyclase domain-containing protein [Actinomycetota bacterium]|nr:adenylate/guanylate cyclase domain-containing protein [Actinomycetota bacterium]